MAKKPSYVDTIKYRELPECTQAKQDEYFATARDFLKSTRLYSSEAGTAACAIADYMAYLDGTQLIRR